MNDSLHNSGRKIPLVFLGVVALKGQEETDWGVSFHQPLVRFHNGGANPFGRALQLSVSAAVSNTFANSSGHMMVSVVGEHIIERYRPWRRSLVSKHTSS